ncbi:MAG TPA: hypothetical protein VFC78_17715 [Tepidisphaeraceae bacterium]|nr:hypothetical protein [Tepidisphaeraceae bacterium]
MARFVKIGMEVINLDAISRITFMENQSGISDRIIIAIGDTSITVDSAIGGRARMNAIREKLMAALEPMDWEPPVDETPTPL